jgi:hypothetical protein
VENVIVHIMSKGDVYNLETRKYEGSAIEIDDED